MMPTIISIMKIMMMKRDEADKGQQSPEASLYYWFGVF